MILYLLFAFLAGAFAAGTALLGGMLLMAWWMIREAEFEADFEDFANPTRYAP